MPGAASHAVWQAVEQGPATVLVADADLRVVYANQRFLDRSGVREADVVGQDLLSLGRAASADDDARLLHLLREGRPWRGQLTARGQDGREYLEQATIVPVRAEDAALTHYVKVAEDITAQQQLEEMLLVTSQRTLDQYSHLLAQINTLAQRVGLAQSLQEVFRALRDFAVATVPFHGMFVSLYDPETQTRSPIYAADADSEDDVSTLPPLPLNNSPNSRAVSEGRPIISEDLQGALADAGVRPINIRLDKDPRLPQSSLAIPLIILGRVIGALEVQSTERAAYSGDHITALRMAATVTAGAVEHVRLLDGLTRRVEELQGLRAIDIAITGSLDLRVTLGVILTQTTQLLKVDAAAIRLLNPGTQMLEFASGRGFRRTHPVPLPFRVGEGPAGRAAIERRAIFEPDLGGALVESEGFVSYAAAPLLAKGQVKGVLEVFHRSRLVAREDWREFFEAIAGQAAIAVDDAELFEGMQRLNVDLMLAYDRTLEGWSRALDLRDKETEGHTERVAELTVRLARAMGLAEEELVHVRRGALLHDIGKMGIPDGILLKPGPLTDAEWDIMRRHPVYAHRLLSPIPYLKASLDIPYCHHERWDGSGYPRGLRGEEIPLGARIFSVVDAWDALISDRPYRPAWSREQTRAYLTEQAGKQFDPEVVRAFLSLGPQELIHSPA